MNKVIIAVLAACAVIGAVWILCADCHAEDYAEQMVQAVLDGDGRRVRFSSDPRKDGLANMSELTYEKNPFYAIR